MQPPNEVITEKILKESLSQNGKVVNNKCSTKALKLPAVYINEEYDDEDDDCDYDD